MKVPRIVALGASTIGVVALAACGSSSSTSSTTSAATDTGSASASAESSSAEPAGDKTATLMVGVKGDPFYVSMQCGAQEAADKMGVTLTVQGPDKFDATLQNPLLDAVVSSKPSALLVAPNDVKASYKPLKAAQDAGIKVVLVDTIVDDPAIGISRISTDNNLAGQTAAEALAKLGVKGKVLVVSTDPGVSSVDARVDGFKAKAGELGFTMASDTQYSHNLPATAAQIITAALKKDPDIAGVFATNLFSAQGVATGLKQAGASGKVKMVGFDAGPDQIKQLVAGDVQALVAQQPYDIGYQGIEQAVNSLDGKTVTDKIATEALIVTKDNMADPEVAKYIYKSGC